MRKKIYILMVFVAIATFTFAQTKQNSNTNNLKTAKSAKQATAKVSVEQTNLADIDPNAQNNGIFYIPSKNLDFSVQGNRSFLYSNGPLITHIGSGPGGADYSLLEYPNTTLGFGHAISTGYMIADNVVINATSWTIDSIAFFSYQTGSTTSSTITGYHVMILDGAPGDTSTNVVWGDTITNVISTTEWTGIYRGSDTTNSDRPVMISYCNTNGLILGGGEYWIVWRCAGSLTSGPWIPPITISGTPATGNAMQYDGSLWNDVIDGGGPQGFPFNIYGTEIPSSCPFPTNINVTNITDISADISWTENGSATNWEVEYGTTVNVSTNPDTSITGLTANIIYDVYVRAVCGAGDTSYWAGPYTFITASCPVSEQCIYTITMDDSYGDGWNGASINVIQDGTTIKEFTLLSGSNSIDSVSICNSSTIELQWNSASFDDEISFTFSDPFAGEIITITDASTLTDGQIFHTFIASCTPPSCLTPTGLTVNNITTTSADLDWTPAGSESAWQIEWGNTNFIQGAGTLANVTTHPYNLTSLSVGTVYDFYVRAVCGAGDTSYWAGPYSFNTLCDAISTFPWIDSFENGITCWLITGLAGVETWEIDDSDPHTGSYNAKCLYDDNLQDQNELLITPLLDFTSVSNGKLDFWFQGSKYWSVAPNDSCDLNVLISTDGGTTWTTDTLWDEEVDTTWTTWEWTNAQVDLSAYAGESTIKIAFQYYGNNGAQFSLDDISIEEGSEIEENSDNTSVNIYPNPAKNLINIKSSDKIENVKIYNLTGQIVFDKMINDNSVQINTSEYKSGIYFIKIRTKDGLINKKITITKN